MGDTSRGAKTSQRFERTQGIRDFAQDQSRQYGSHKRKHGRHLYSLVSSVSTKLSFLIKLLR